MTDKILIRNLCHCIAILADRGELMARLIRPADTEFLYQAQEAKFLVAEAGFDFNKLAAAKW